jgi:hypothetical protein
VARTHGAGGEREEADGGVLPLCRLWINKRRVGLMGSVRNENRISDFCFNLFQQPRNEKKLEEIDRCLKKM